MHRQVPVRQFPQGNHRVDLRPGEIALGILTPWSTAADTVRAWKTAKRRHDCQALVTACFSLHRASGPGDETRAILALGGIATQPWVAVQTSSALAELVERPEWLAGAAAAAGRGLLTVLEAELGGVLSPRLGHHRLR